MESYQIKTFDQYKAAYQKSVDQPGEFWGEIAENFQWHRKWDKVLEWNFKEPRIEWFKGARLNITENCLDRHLEHNGDKVAILWELYVQRTACAGLFICKCAEE